MNSQLQSKLPVKWFFLGTLLLLFFFLIYGFSSENQFTRLLTDLKNLQVQPDQIREVSGIELQRDVGRFVLENGKLAVCTPVLGKPSVIVFVGSGTFRYSPPTKIEKENLFRFYESDSLTRRFSTLFLLYTDSTWSELMKKSQPLNVTGDTPVLRKAIETALPYILNEKKKVLRPAVARALLNPEVKGYFWAFFYQNKMFPLAFEVDPFQREEVTFYRRTENEKHLRRLEIINKFHKQSDYQNQIDLSHEQKWDFDVVKQVHRAEIQKNLNFRSSADLTIVLKANNLNWSYLSLFKELKVDSLIEAKRGALSFFKSDKDSYVWFKLPADVEQGDTLHLKMFYDGKLLEKRGDWIFIRDPRNWYPRHAPRDKALFDLTFKVPAKYDFVSVGNFISADTTADFITSHWKTDRPIRNAGFNIGFFKKLEIRGEMLPLIEILMSPAAHSELKRKGIYTDRDIDEQVGKDARQALQFFQLVFGIYPFPRLAVSEIPYNIGEAFPGLIHLGVSTFLKTDLEGFDHVFRAHEVAHQWWGIGVDFQTYHDQWLSEAFAQYGGLWYLQMVLKRNDLYEKILKKWREKILYNREFLLETGQKAGPIWLGYRTYSSSTPEDFNIVIYLKGAWVLHMLRYMLTDLKTMDDQKFIIIMRDFYRQFLGKKATTLDFQKMVEKHTWQDMQWFFDQWVYSTEIPTYYVSRKTKKDSEGKYRVYFKVRQENVPASFRMSVPITIRCKRYKVVRFRQLITGPVTRFQSPILPDKPTKIIFNDFEGVLGEVKKEKWVE